MRPVVGQGYKGASVSVTGLFPTRGNEIFHIFSNTAKRSVDLRRSTLNALGGPRIRHKVRNWTEMGTEYLITRFPDFPCLSGYLWDTA